MRFIKFGNSYIAEENIAKFVDEQNNFLTIYTKLPAEKFLIRFNSEEEKMNKIAEILNQEEV